MRRVHRRSARRFRTYTVTVALATLATPQVRATAQIPPVSTAPARLGGLYERLARDNPTVSAAEALARAAQARVPGTKRPPDPQLQLGFMNYAIPSLRPMQPLGMTQLQIMQMVPLGGKLTIAGRVAGAQAAATNERARDALWELRWQTAIAFYDLYATDRKLDVARETLCLLQDIARTAQSMYRVGEGRQADVLRANVEVAKMAEDTLRMQAMRTTTVSRLNALLDRSADEHVAAVVRPQFPDSMPTPEWLDSIAAADRPMIRAGLQDVRAAGASAALARKEIIPDLQVGVQYGQRGATMTDANGTTSRTTERMGSVMIGASIPIFARDRQLQMRTEADAMKSMALADLAVMRADTRGKIGEAYADLMRARDLARLYRTTVLPQAQATVSSALSSYRVGEVDFTTLLDDQMTVNEYRQELFALEADEGKAWAELEMLTGRELIDSNSSAVTTATNVAAKRGEK